MADAKISALTELAASDVDTANDVLAIVDGGATTKKITAKNLLAGIIQDPITATAGASVTVDLESRGIAVVQFNMAGYAGTMSLTLNNPVDGGIYIFHYLDADSSPSVTYPGTVNGQTPRGTHSDGSGWPCPIRYSTAS